MARNAVIPLFLLVCACGGYATKPRPVCTPHPTGHVQISTLVDDKTVFADSEPGYARTNYMTGVVVDADRNLFVSDQFNNQVYRYAHGALTDHAGTGQFAFPDGFVHEDGSIAPDGTGGRDGNAQFQQPAALALDAEGRLIVADIHDNRVRRIELSGRVTTLAGNGHWGYRDGPAAEAEFFNPEGVAINGEGAIYVADTENHRIRRIGLDGQVTTVAGNGAGESVDGPALTASFKAPRYLAFDSRGNLFIRDGYDIVRKLDASGQVTTLEELKGTIAFALDAEDNIYLAGGFHVGGGLKKIDPAGQTTILLPGNEQAYDTEGAPAFSNVGGLAVDCAGAVYAADGKALQVLRP